MLTATLIDHSVIKRNFEIYPRYARHRYFPFASAKLRIIFDSTKFFAIFFFEPGGHSADVSHFTGQGQKPDSAFDPDFDLSVRRRLPYLLGGCCLGCLCLKCGLGGCLFGCELLSFLLRY